jgi:hypothetical protein
MKDFAQIIITTFDESILYTHKTQKFINSSQCL